MNTKRSEKSAKNRSDGKTAKGKDAFGPEVEWKVVRQREQYEQSSGWHDQTVIRCPAREVKDRSLNAPPGFRGMKSRSFQ